MKLKKQLGQHFLKDEAICLRIVEQIPEPDLSEATLLEIGPGAGALTKYLLDKNIAEFKVVEIDDEKAKYLLHHLPINSDQVILNDVLKIPQPFTHPFHIIGNFPYNISSQILFRILDWRANVSSVVGMFQKEVAVRVSSGEGNKDYGILSVLIQAYFDAEYLFDVDEDAFRPPPKVKSGVIRLVNNRDRYKIKYTDKFFKLVKQAFAMRRKTLRNNLKQLLDPEILQEDLFGKRAEQLSVAAFIELYKRIYE